MDAHVLMCFMQTRYANATETLKWLWQCHILKCGGSGNIWRAPLNQDFVVDPETMHAPDAKMKAASTPISKSYDSKTTGPNVKYIIKMLVQQLGCLVTWTGKTTKAMDLVATCLV
jgi:hypothetical protein